MLVMSSFWLNVYDPHNTAPGEQMQSGLKAEWVIVWSEIQSKQHKLAIFPKENVLGWGLGAATAFEYTRTELDPVSPEIIHFSKK